MISSPKCFPTNYFTCKIFLTPPLNVLKIVAKAGDVRTWRNQVEFFQWTVSALSGGVH